MDALQRKLLEANAVNVALGGLSRNCNDIFLEASVVQCAKKYNSG